jgi:hypothetical protein
VEFDRNNLAKTGLLLLLNKKRLGIRKYTIISSSAVGPEEFIRNRTSLQ